MDADLKFLHRDKPVTKEEVASRAVLVAEGRTVRAFDSDEEFKNWAKKTKHADKISRADKSIRDLIKDKDKFNDDMIQGYNEKMKNIGEALNDLAERTGLTPASEALFRRATVDRPPNEPEIFDPAIIYEGSNYTGQWLPVYSGSPDLTRVRGSFPSDWWGKYHWNDRISSVRMLGAGVLTEHTWYQGRWFWLLNYQVDIATPGPDEGQFNFNLPDYGFDNTASAMFFL